MAHRKLALFSLGTVSGLDIHNSGEKMNSDGGFWENFIIKKIKECKKGIFALLAFGRSCMKVRCLELLQPFCKHEENSLG